MKQLASIFFHVNPRDPKFPMSTAKFHRKIQIDVALLGNGNVKLGNLVPLGEVRVEILLPIKLGGHRDFTVESKAQFDGTLNNLLVQNRQRPRVAHAGGADCAVGLGAVAVRARTKRLCDGRELDVGLDSNHSFKTLCLLLRRLLGRQLNRLGRRFGLGSLRTLRPGREAGQPRA